VYPAQQVRIGRRVPSPGHRVDSTHYLVHRTHPRGSGIGLGACAKAHRGHVLRGTLQPRPEIGLKARALVHPGHREGVQCLKEQGADSADANGRVGQHPPGHAPGPKYPRSSVISPLKPTVVSHATVAASQRRQIGSSASSSALGFSIPGE
jgi:hypothetical protein